MATLDTRIPAEQSSTPVLVRQQRRSRIFNKSRLYLVLYVLMLPTIISMALLSYYPKFDVIAKSFFRWEPQYIYEWVGSDNFIKAFTGDALFWASFQLVAIMLVANLFKMWPSIFSAIVLHRLKSSRARYVYQVLFVIPMVIPGLVWLLIWKSFFDPTVGVFNRVLNATGILKVLLWLDTAMPKIAASINTEMALTIDPVWGNVWGFMLFGAMVLTWMNNRDRTPARWQKYQLLVSLAVWMGVANYINPLPFVFFLAPLILMAVFMPLYLGKGWIIWPFWIIAGVWACMGEYPWQLAILVVLSICVVEVVNLHKDHITTNVILKTVGIATIVLGGIFILLSKIWIEPTHAFDYGNPAWLGDRDLMISALIIWGFPWVGVVGVLIYLAGLQQISEDVYEAAELDGVGWFGKIFQIELPLIMTQVRINLIFMTIGTLTGYEMFLLLFGPEGGAESRGMVPGLYMYNKAFGEGYFGYACALGMVMFVLILLLTVIYQRYVKVEK